MGDLPGTIVFVVTLTALTTHFSLYVLILAAIRWLRPRPLRTGVADEREVTRRLTILIATYNEEALIEQKLDNLLGLLYPRSQLEVLLVDGGSTDRTLDLAEQFRARAGELSLRILRSERRGKIPQLNAALEVIEEDRIVVVTDADALIETPDALVRTVFLLEENESAGVVGGWTRPRESTDGLHAESGYWDKQNRLRYLETEAFSSSIVVAPFYAFRRSMMRAFPPDCVADDVYVSFVAHGAGLRVIYAPEIPVLELRQPATLRELFLHKLRKADAYAKEIVRFTPRMVLRGPALFFFAAFRLFQFTCLPAATIGFAASSIDLLLARHFGLVGGGLVLFGLLILMASASMSPPPGHTRGGLRLISLRDSILIFGLMLIVLNLNIFLYPFRRQGSSYSRIGKRRTAVDPVPAERAVHRAAVRPSRSM